MNVCFLSWIISAALAFFKLPLFFSISLFYDDKESVFLRFPLLLPLFIFHPCTFPPSFPLLAQANFSFSYLPVCRLVARALSSLSQGFLFSLVSCTPFISPSTHPCYWHALCQIWELRECHDNTGQCSSRALFFLHDDACSRTITDCFITFWPLSSCPLLCHVVVNWSAFWLSTRAIHLINYVLVIFFVQGYLLLVCAVLNVNYFDILPFMSGRLRRGHSSWWWKS